ncbi:MAG: branched-chain amino acid transport system II carrier protein [Limosilactobacillus sp.]|uniref:branched-chain amino acid transport system II carrier protein n=1 Tax=Limosilactobacillus sp. TaxID=2773925 RepID=UPI0026FD4D44|nr:branched-chain amino acid transport system II carrier protein [Limosilactobacillus sp.]
MKEKMKIKPYLIIGSLIFGMIFGAGNLVFPVHLGQIAGRNWGSAAAGFILSGVLLPLLALLSLSVTKTKGLYELSRPVGDRFAVAFLIFVNLAIGPLCATPRTATVPYTVGIAPFLSPHLQGVGLVIYTGLFFLLTYYFATMDGGITEIIGKILNPAFLVMLFVIFLMAFIHPMGKLSAPQPTAEYLHQSFTNGVLQGYNTMDTLAMLIFGVTIIAAVREMGFSENQVPLATIRGGLVAVIGVGLIYLCLIYLGTTSRTPFAIASNGGTTLNQVAHYYLGIVGNVLLCTLATVTCLTTAMGLVVSFSKDFHQRFPKISYKAFLRIVSLVSFAIANLGLDKIVSWSAPFLMLIYPLSIVLVLCGLLSRLFENNAWVYRFAMVFTAIPAIFDAVKSIPVKAGVVTGMTNFASANLPLFDLGFAWMPFALLGFVIGMVAWRIERYNINKQVG